VAVERERELVCDEQILLIPQRQARFMDALPEAGGTLLGRAGAPELILQPTSRSLALGRQRQHCDDGAGSSSTRRAVFARWSVDSKGADNLNAYFRALGHHAGPRLIPTFQEDQPCLYSQTVTLSHNSCER
jgi:hypothetical protein